MFSSSTTAKVTALIPNLNLLPIKSGVTAASAIVSASPVGPAVVLAVVAVTGATTWKAMKLKQRQQPKHRRLHYKTSTAVQPQPTGW